MASIKERSNGAYSGVRGLIGRSQKSVLVSGQIGVESPANKTVL